MRNAWEWKRDEDRERVVPAQYCLDVSVQNSFNILNVSISCVHVVSIITWRDYFRLDLGPRFRKNDDILFRSGLLNISFAI